MAQDSKIEWCNHTANLWWGCTEVHAGCDNCYARVLSHRWGQEVWGNDVPRREIKSTFNDLLKYQKNAAAVNEVHKIFVGSMMDIFEKPMPLVDVKGNKVMVDVPTDIGPKRMQVDTGVLREQLFDEITWGKYPNLMFLLLTKRPSNINKYIPESWKENPPSNVMFGTSPVDQKTFDTLIPQLYQVNGKKFLSIEPMLDKVDITKDYPVGKGEVAMGLLVDWIICGGESGGNKRPFNLLWARELHGQCSRYDIPFFMKQIDKVQPIPEDLLIRQFPTP